jgi:nucleotide-binding universal stress UspA family protein
MTLHPTGVDDAPISPRPTHTPGQNRPGAGRADRGLPAEGYSAPSLIGVGVDGTSSGQDAVVFGSLLAGATGAELMLIAVHEEPLIQLSMPEGMSWSTLHEQARAVLAQTRDTLAPDARVALQPDVLVWRGLRHVVRRDHRDLLVVGSARDADDGFVRLGRNASELLTHLECPLAITPLGFHRREDHRLQRIGVGFDGAPESRAAVRLAGAIASAAGATLHVRGVVNDRVAGGLRAEYITLAGDAIVGEQLLSLLDRELGAARETGARIALDVIAGPPADALSDLCERADLVVLGSGHTGRAGRVQLGHASKAVVDGARCPLLITPRPVD